MKKYNITKRWTIKGKTYMAFVGTKRGLTLEEASRTLERAYFIESSQEFQDTEIIDEDLWQFSVTKNGVEFVYSIEDDEPFQEMSEILRPSNCCHFNISQN